MLLSNLEPLGLETFNKQLILKQKQNKNINPRESAARQAQTTHVQEAWTRVISQGLL